MAANLVVFPEAQRSWRRVKVNERWAAEDFAACMRDLVDIRYSLANAFHPSRGQMRLKIVCQTGAISQHRVQRRAHNYREH